MTNRPPTWYHTGTPMRKLFTDPELRPTILLLLITEFLWGVGMYLTLPSTTQPAYLRSLGASKLLIGLLITGNGALMLLMQHFGRPVLERFRRRKRGLILLHGGFILPYLLIPLADVLLPDAQRGVLVALTMVGLIGSSAVMGLIIPLWLDMLGRVIPLEIRGRYFGISSGCLAIGGILGGVVLIVLQRWLGDGVFRAALGLAGVFYLLSMVALANTRIPEDAFDHAPTPSLLVRLRQGVVAAHPRTNFGRLVFSIGVMGLLIAMVPFLEGYAASPRGLGLDRAIFSRITLWQALGSAGGAFILGWLVDHLGPRRPWVVVAAAGALVMALYPLGGWLPVLVGCSLLVGILTVQWAVTAPAMLELSPDGDKSTYIAIANLATLPAAVIGPLLFALLIEGCGYQAALGLALVAGVAACGLALMIRERRAAPAQQSGSHITEIGISSDNV